MALILLVIIAAGSRITLDAIGVANNVAPITAIAMFLACYRPSAQAATATLAIRFVSDLFIGFFSWPLMVAVYASHLLGIPLGRWIARRHSWTRIISAPLLSATLFFVVTNFALLYPASQYSHDWSGIWQSYLNALPFFRGTLAGDLAYTALLFGGYAAVRRLGPSPARSQA